jgi:hypothetical protein
MGFQQGGFYTPAGGGLKPPTKLSVIRFSPPCVAEFQTGKSPEQDWWACGLGLQIDFKTNGKRDPYEDAGLGAWKKREGYFGLHQKGAVWEGRTHVKNYLVRQTPFLGSYSPARPKGELSWVGRFCRKSNFTLREQKTDVLRTNG